MAVTNKSKSFSSVLSTALNSFRGVKIKTKRGILSVHRINANLIRNFDSQEIQIKIYYKYSHIIIKGKENKSVEEEMLNDFIQNIVEEALLTWKAQEGVETNVEE